MEHVQSPSLIPHSPRVQWANSLLYDISIMCGSQWRLLSCTSLRPHSGGSGDHACTRAGTIRYQRKSVMFYIQILGCSVPYRLIAVWPAWVIEIPRGTIFSTSIRILLGYRTRWALATLVARGIPFIRDQSAVTRDVVAHWT